jgi:soluble lytic murein transglycosylase-like protein
VAELLPDEVPFARTVAIEALAASPAAAAPALSRVAIQSLASRIAAKVGLDDKLAEAVIQVESNFDQRAVSSRGAMGLMQIMPAVAQQYALADPFEPEQNLEAGMKYLRTMLTRFADVRKALAAYNAGEGAVILYGGVPPYRETEDYVRRIMAIIRR